MGSKIVWIGLRGVMSLGLLTVLSASSCEEDPTCGDACYKLAYCEDEWLREEGQDEMSDKAFDRYVETCESDCRQSSDRQDDIDCIAEASCDRLAEGDCI